MTCDFWYNSACSQAESLYGVNDQIGVSNNGGQAQYGDGGGGQAQYGGGSEGQAQYGGGGGGQAQYGGGGGGGQAQYGGGGVGQAQYGNNGLPSYNQATEEALSSYSGGSSQSGGRVNQYGRDAKALELEETVVFTTPAPDTPTTTTFLDDLTFDDDELPLPEAFHNKRNLRPFRRRSNKYRWRSYS